MLTISAKIIANAKKSSIVDEGIDSMGRRNFKIKVNQPAEDSKANAEVVQLVADYFKVKKNQVTIVSGELAKNKIIEIGTIIP